MALVTPDRVNGGFDYHERLGEDSRGRSLLGHLVARHRHSSEAEWRERIDSGLVSLDGRPGNPGSLVRPGQLVVWRRPPWREPDAPTSFGVLLEDDDLVAVCKPAGLPTLPGAGYLENTLLGLVRKSVPGASPLHRLGRWTSGIVLFARHAGAGRTLARIWGSREVIKRYRALASGEPADHAFAITVPIGEVAHPRLGTIHAASPRGKAAVSRVVVVERNTGSFVCEVFIETGRPHQIRIHLAAAGHPLVGDPVYVAGGRPPDGSTSLPGEPGYLLHAAELTFPHPRSGIATTVTCPPPPGLGG